MADHDDQTDQLVPGWWKTKAGWKAAGNRPATESGWLLLFAGVAIAAVMVLVGSRLIWSAAAFTIVISTAGLLPKRVVVGLCIALFLVILVVQAQPVS